MSRPSEPEEQVADPLRGHLKERFDQVRTLVERRSTFDPAEFFRNLPEPTVEDERAYRRDEARREHRRQHDPILREAQAYLQLARTWFEVESDGMRAHADACVRRAEVEDVDDISLSELSRVLDSIDIVRNDCCLIYVKLHRAIDGFEDDAGHRSVDAIQNNYNGSAKLALMCIDRCEGAWRAIDQWYPSCGGAKALADQLAALRRTVEARLPHARAFLRPGFDGLITPD